MFYTTTTTRMLQRILKNVLSNRDTYTKCMSSFFNARIVAGIYHSYRKINSVRKNLLNSLKILKNSIHYSLVHDEQIFFIIFTHKICKRNALQGMPVSVSRYATENCCVFGCSAMQ